MGKLVTSQSMPVRSCGFESDSTESTRSTAISRIWKLLVGDWGLHLDCVPYAFVQTKALVFPGFVSCVERAVERDHFMDAEEALKFGLIDKILEKRPSSVGVGSS